MGQIANQMALELFFRLKENIKEKREKEKQKQKEEKPRGEKQEEG